MKDKPKAGSLHVLVRRKRSRRWRSSYEKPPRRGWYECKARDDRWGGKTQWRAWGRGMWWIPLGKGDGSDGWLSSPMGIYKWRGPARDVMGPPPDFGNGNSSQSLGAAGAQKQGPDRDGTIRQDLIEPNDQADRRIPPNENT